MASRNRSREATGGRAGERSGDGSREARGGPPAVRAADPAEHGASDAALVRVHDLAGRPRGTGFLADHHGTVLTSHEAVDGLTRLVLSTAGGRRRVVAAADVVPLPALGLALVRTEGLGAAPLPLSTRDRVEAGTYVRIAAGGWREARVLGATDVTYTATDRFHLLGDALELAVGTCGRDALRLGGGAAGGPVLDVATGAVLGVLGTALSSGHSDVGFAVPLRRAAAGPLSDLLAENAATVPAYGADLNLAGVLALTATSVTEAVPDGGPDAREPVERAGVTREFAAFDTSGARVLGLVGAPGSGRTTELAALAARRSGAGGGPHAVAARGRSARRRHVAGGRGPPDAGPGRPHRRRPGPGRPGPRRPRRRHPRTPRPPGPHCRSALLVALDGPEEMPPVLAHRLPEWTERTAAWLRETDTRLVVACRAEYWEHAGAEFPRELLHDPDPGAPSPGPTGAGAARRPTWAKEAPSPPASTAPEPWSGPGGAVGEAGGVSSPGTGLRGSGTVAAGGVPLFGARGGVSGAAGGVPLPTVFTASEPRPGPGGGLPPGAEVAVPGRGPEAAGGGSSQGIGVWEPGAGAAGGAPVFGARGVAFGAAAWPRRTGGAVGPRPAPGTAAGPSDGTDAVEGGPASARRVTAGGARGRGQDGLLPCVRLGDLRDDEAREARARHGVLDGALADPDAGHPLTIRLLSEVRAALPGPPAPVPVTRDAVFTAYLDLMCLRVATRLADENGLRGTAVRRLAAKVSGQVHEAARRSLGPGQGGLDRESFETLFPCGPAPARLGGGTGWAPAVLAEGLFVPTGSGYRFAHEELADWIQGTHLDLGEALRALVHRRDTPLGTHTRTLPVPHHRIGSVVEALLLLARQHGVPQLALTLEELVHALDRDPHSWWAARLLAEALTRVPDATPYTDVLRLLADGIAERAGDGQPTPQVFGPAFWTAPRVPRPPAWTCCAASSSRTARRTNPAPATWTPRPGCSSPTPGPYSRSSSGGSTTNGRCPPPRTPPWRRPPRRCCTPTATEAWTDSPRCSSTAPTAAPTNCSPSWPRRSRPRSAERWSGGRATNAQRGTARRSPTACAPPRTHAPAPTAPCSATPPWCCSPDLRTARCAAARSPCSSRTRTAATATSPRPSTSSPPAIRTYRRARWPPRCRPTPNPSSRPSGPDCSARTPVRRCAGSPTPPPPR